MSIPHVIHQTWKDECVLEHIADYVASWKEHHPDWQFRLWTDDEYRITGRVHAHISAAYAVHIYYGSW